MNDHDHFDLERRLVKEARQFQDRPTGQADPDALQREARRRRRRSRTAMALVMLIAAVSVGTAIHFGTLEPNRPGQPRVLAQAPLSRNQPADAGRSPSAPRPETSPATAMPVNSQPVEYVVAIPDGNQLRVIGRLIYPAGKHGPPKREELASLLPVLAVRRSVGFGELSVVQQTAVRQLFGMEDSTPSSATF